MANDSVERGWGSDFVVGFLVIAAMFAGGGAVGWLLRLLDVPYGVWIGTAIGALAVLAGFVVLSGRARTNE